MATRTKRPEPGLYVAVTTGVVKYKGVIYRYTRGRTIVKEDHPVLRAVPGSFTTLDISGPEIVAL